MEKAVSSILQEFFMNPCVSEYVKSEQSADEYNMIIEMLARLRELLIPEYKQLLNQLLDNINNDDSRYLYEAFKNGFLIGMAFIADKAVVA